MNWVKREPPKKFDFGDGVCLVGVLINLERANVRDKRTQQPKVVNRYTVREMVDGTGELGKTVFFFGTVQIDSMLHVGDIGHFVSVTCIGEDKTAGRQGNAMKLFDVNVIEDSTAPGWASNGTPITDDDLPASDYFA